MTWSRSIRAFGVSCLLSWAAPASAQEQQPLDAHGVVPPAPAADASSPLTLWSPRVPVAGAWSIGALAEVADTPAVQYQLLGPDELQTVSVVGPVAALNLGGQVALLDRLAVGGVLPVFLASVSDLPGVGGGPALGDLYVRGQVGLLLPEGGVGAGISVVPWVQLPTGATGRFLGDPGAGAGLVGVAGWRSESVSVDLNLGLSAVAVADRATQDLGGLEIPIGVAGGLRVADGWWTHLELRGVADPGAGVVNVPAEPSGQPSFPVEALLTFSADLGNAWGTAGVGRGITGGLGAARIRAFAGAGVASRPEPPEPEALVPVVFRVVDPSGAPITGAEVSIGETVAGATDPAGTLSVERVRWARGVSVRAPRFESATVAEPPEGTSDVEVVLPWTPQLVRARVTDQEGQPVAAELQLTDADGGEPVVGAPGEVTLPPGTWEVRIDAAEKGTQVRQLVVEPGRPPRELEVALLPAAGDGVLSLTIVGDDGAPVHEARVLVDGLPVGTTADGGVLEVRGLAPGEHDVQVQHQAYTERVLEAVLVADDEPTLVPLSLERIPGTVRVQVRGPDDRIVPDAMVRFIGPRVLPAAPLGDRGERVQVLGPGRWIVLVTSEAYGVQEREVIVPEDRYDVIEVDVRLLEAEAGDVELVVTVVDPAGGGLEGASVWLDDEQVGRTSTGGSLRLKGLAPGTRALRVGGEGLRTWEDEALVLVSGTQDELVELGWLPGSVEVVASSPDGPVADAQVRFVGAETRGPDPLGRGGTARFQLDAGDWVVLVTSETWGMQERDLSLPADSDLLHRVDVGFLPVQGGMATLDLRVVGPDGAPVRGAEVLLDGAAVGATTGGGLRQRALAVGTRELTVRSPLYREETRRIRLLEGTNEQEIGLEWAPGAARVSVTHDGAPVTDAVVRFLGSEAHEPVPVDASGAAAARLVPGDWTVLVTSPSLGVAQRALTVPDPPGGLVELDVPMVPPDATLTDLVLRIEDPDRGPVVGATVWLDDSKLGETIEGGLVVARNLPPGTARLRVEAPTFQDLVEDQLVLKSGRSERRFTLSWVPVPLTVTVTDGSGAPVAAEVRFSGRADVDPVRAGTDGVAAVELRPGDWQIIAAEAAGGLGPARADVRLEAGSDGEAVALVLERARVELTDEAVVIKERVNFEFDSARLTEGSAPVLQQVADTLLSRAGIVTLEVQGHTDNIGDIAYNQALSERRAEAVVEALVERGVPPEKLVARGYGTQRPVAPNDTDEGRAENRRVVFEIVEQVAE